MFQRVEGKGRDRNMYVRETHPLVASGMHPDQGQRIEPAIEVWHLTGIELATLHSEDQCSIH